MKRTRLWIGLCVFFFSVLACNIGVLPPQESLEREQASTMVVLQATPTDTLQSSPAVPTDRSETATPDASSTASATVPSGDPAPSALPFPTLSLEILTEIFSPNNQPAPQDSEKPASPPPVMPTDPPVMGIVRGTVTGVEVDGKNEQPVAKAKVFIQPGNYEATTDSDGKYKFDGIPIGEITILVAHTKYETGIRNVNVKSGQANVFNFVIKKTVPHEVTPCPFLICPPIPIPTIAEAENPYFDPGVPWGN